MGKVPKIVYIYDTCAYQISGSLLTERPYFVCGQEWNRGRFASGGCKRGICHHIKDSSVG